MTHGGNPTTGPGLMERMAEINTSQVHLVSLRVIVVGTGGETSFRFFC